jgi:hypothetical protein
MEYEQLENDIIAQLTPGLPGVDVLALPDNLADFDKSPKLGKVTVAYRGSKFKQQSTSAHSYSEIVEFELIVEGRRLRGETGVYAFLEKIKRLILGHKLTNTDKVFLQDQTIVVREAKQETFSYTMSIACSKVVVEDINVTADASYIDYP